MENNVWYLNDSEESYGSYTDFTTGKTEQIVRKAPVKKVRTGTARRCAKRKSSAGKVLLSVVGAMAIAAVSISGTWFYLTEVKDNDDLDEVFNIKEDAEDKISGFFSGKDAETDDRDDKVVSVKSDKKSSRDFGTGSGPAYDVAESIMSGLWCDNDFDTAYEIFNWVHSNISYQVITEELSYEDAAYRGFTRKSGDCFVYFSCAKMLLDCAGIPNMMVERYPVITNGHYWNLVQIDGEWYHCDATVFKDHPGMYFLCTDDEIADEHHSFDGDLYPERAQSYTGYSECEYYGGYYDDGYYYGDSYIDYSDEYYDGYYDGGYYDGYYDDGYYDDGYYEDDYYGNWGYGPAYAGEWGW